MTDAPQLPPSFRLIAHGVVSSTSDVARELAGAGAADGTLVWAQRQTAGRGRLGRSFASPVGNLYMSLILRPEIRPIEAPQLSFVAAVALADAVAAVLPAMVPIGLKWPNDLMLNDRKAAGILVEAETSARGLLEFAVLGIGVNLVSHPTGLAYRATDLGVEGAAVTAASLLELLAGHLASWRERWRADGFAPVRAAWLARARGLGAPIDVRVGDTLIRGRFVDLDGDGAMIIEGAGGTRRRVTAGDIAETETQRA